MIKQGPDAEKHGFEGTVLIEGKSKKIGIKDDY